LFKVIVDERGDARGIVRNIEVAIDDGEERVEELKQR